MDPVWVMQAQMNVLFTQARWERLCDALVILGVACADE
jgi:hypothetical protein